MGDPSGVCIYLWLEAMTMGEERPVARGLWAQISVPFPSTRAVPYETAVKLAASPLAIVQLDLKPETERKAESSRLSVSMSLEIYLAIAAAP